VREVKFNPLRFIKLQIKSLFFYQKNFQSQSHQETKKNTKEAHHNYYLTLGALCSVRVLVLSKLFCSLLRYTLRVTINSPFITPKNWRKIKNR